MSEPTAILELAEGFWGWWAEARPRVEAELAEGRIDRMADELTARARALDERMQWEITRSDDAVWALCLSGAGDPRVRILAERVVRAGPGDDAMWSYHAVRLPHPGTIDGQLLELAGHEVKLGDARFSIHIDDERQVLDITAYHPAFATLDRAEQGTVAFLIIEGILGEDGVERWIGMVELTAEDPADGLPPEALAEAADGLADRHTEPSWCLMSGSGDGGQPLFVMARRPLKRVEAPLFDLHAVVMLIGYEVDDAGLPTKEALEQLTSLEDGLAAALDGDAVVVAHVTVSGRRTTHLYCDQFGPAPGLISTWTATLAGDGVEAVVSFDLDPAWDEVRAFV